MLLDSSPSSPPILCTLSPLRHFALHLWFRVSVFQVLLSQEGLCFTAPHSWAPSGTSHEGISDFLTLYPLDFFQSLLCTEINVWWATPQQVKEQWKQRVLSLTTPSSGIKCHHPSPPTSLRTGCGSVAACTDLIAGGHGAAQSLGLSPASLTVHWAMSDHQADPKLCAFFLWLAFCWHGSVQHQRTEPMEWPTWKSRWRTGPHT